MKRVEIEMLKEKEDEGVLDRVVEILSGGIFAFLEEEGLLREEKGEKD